jgi:hypothetical protein
MLLRTGKMGLTARYGRMAVAHATHIYNHTPNPSGICPADIFTGNMIPRHRLKDLHVWGCPVYSLTLLFKRAASFPVGSLGLVWNLHVHQSHSLK